MKKKMSPRTRILAVIAILATVGVVVALIVVFMICGGNTDNGGDNNSSNGETTYNDLSSAVRRLPDSNALNFILSELDGYWISGQQFVRFAGGGFGYGLLQSGFGVSGEITGAEIAGNNSFALKVFISAQSASELDDGYPERTETIYIDISHFDKDGRINIKIANLGDGQWQTYDYSGKELE